VNARSSSLRLVALALVISLPLVGVAGVAGAKPHHHHHHHHGAGSGSGGGKGGAAPAMVVSASPNPLVETNQSAVNIVVQVETSPSLSGDQVVLSSSQLLGSCALVYFQSVQANTGQQYNNTFYTQDAPITVTLDNDGNVTVIVNGNDCAPGNDLIDASLAAAPYFTALTSLVVEPPQVTPPGVTGYPNPEVETGEDMSSPFCGGGGDGEGGPCTSLGSDVYAVFYVETSPVYAEQSVEISARQLEDSCIGGFDWYSADDNDIITQSPPQQILDDDGNAVIAFFGTSCAAGTWAVIADVLAGSHPTYVTTYTVLPPAPTI